MREALERDGFVAAGRVLDDGQVAAARDAAAGLLAERGASSDYGVIALDAWRHAPALRALLGVVASPACELLEVEAVVAFQDLVIDKPPSGAADLPWHQDATYLPLDRDDGVVAWVALDDADAARGCLRYRPLDVDGRPPFVAEAAAGDAWFHTMRTWHTSPPNRAAEHRRAWSIWFVREDTRWAPERASHPYLLELAPAAGARLDGGRFPRFERG